ncbi:hypothetical protein RhoFasB10_03709 [Rhodococcus sp. B10]|nr:hypothetical protein [Rhodococcus sp. B10]
MLRCQLRQRMSEIARNFELGGGTEYRLLRRARAVDRQRQQIRKIGQLTRPERQLRRHHRRRIVLVTEQRTLPQRVIGILHRQRLPIRRLTVHPSRIRHHHISSQRRHRRTVGSNVMHHDRQHELIDRNPIQPSTERNIRRHIETQTRIGRDAIGRLCNVHVGHGQRPCRGDDFGRVDGKNVLMRDLVGHREHGSQRLVSSDHVGDGRFQRGHVDRALHADRERNVVGG